MGILGILMDIEDITDDNRRVAGLNSGRAKAIVEYREKQGEFESRAELRKVKGVGEKVFQQCAGFIRVTPRQADTRCDIFKILTMVDFPSKLRLLNYYV